MKSSDLSIEDRVYFGRGPLEFVGTVKKINLDENDNIVEVSVLGVETGCNFKEKSLVQIKKIENLSKLSEEEFFEKIKNEICFEEEKDVFKVKQNFDKLKDIKSVKNKNKIKV